MATEMKALTDYEPAELAEALRRAGHKPSHAHRLLRRMYQRPHEFEIPAAQFGRGLTDWLAKNLRTRQSRIVRRTTAADGTVKVLVGFEGGGAAEAVLMPAYDGRRAAGCVSSQIGCAMGCDFCASAIGGLERNLSAGEIVEQFLWLRQLAWEMHRRLSTLVFMGMGEPMHNLDHVIAAIRRIAGPELGELGGRQITVSTVGIVPGIDALAEADLNVHLAVSLHAPDDDTRRQIIPAAKRYRVAEILDAVRRFQARTGRIPTIEYTLLAGVNDSDEQARLLATVLEGMRVHVNVIPYNPTGLGVGGRVYQRPTEHRTGSFVAILRSEGVAAHIRRPRGDDVNAACGQLRRQAAASAGAR